MTMLSHSAAQILPSDDDDFARVQRLIQRGGQPVDVALAYALMGWPVGPCDHRLNLPSGRKRAKIPLQPCDRDQDGKSIKGTGGLKKFTTDPDAIEALWRKWPLALVGVRTGLEIGKFVIDIDVEPGETVDDVLHRLTNAVGPIPAGPITITPSGGMHLWFEMPEGVEVRNSAQKLQGPLKKKGIDWRGEGGFVVLSPSCMEDGKAYSWAVAPWERPFPKPTPHILDFVLQRGAFERGRPDDAPENRRARPPQKPERVPGSIADRRKQAAAMRALNEEIATLEALTDGRYNYVFRAAVKLGQHVGGGWLSRSVVDSALETACRTNGLVTKRGIQAVRTQIDNGLERGIAEPRTMAHIDEDVARQEERRGSSRRPPQPSEPDGASPAPIPLNTASKGDSTYQTNVAPFPLPAIRDTAFAWRHYDGRPWLCTAQQKSRRDKETGEEISYTKYEPVSSAFQVEAWLHIAGAERSAGLRIALLDRHGELITVDIRRSHLSRGQSSVVLERLYEAGLLIEQETTLVQILRTADPKKEITILPTTGWHELPGQTDGPVFATPAGAVIGSPAQMAVELDSSIALEAAHATRGSFDEWKTTISQVFSEDGVPHLRLGIMAGFAGPLLRLAGLDSCGIVLSGHTSRGKTTAQKLAASLWSQQTVSQPGLFKSAFTTLNALEDLLQTGDGTLLALDELALLDGKAIGKLIFEIASGTGKSRLNADGSKRRSRTWRTFVVLSSEDPLERRITEDRGTFTEGASLRILDIDVSSVEHRDRGALFQRIAQLQAHYGHAGPRFVEELVRNGWHRCGDELRMDVLELARTLVGSDAPSPALLRAAEPLAVIWKAAEFAREFGLIPADADCEKAIRWAWERFLEGAERLVRTPEERAIEALSLFIAQRWDSTIRDLDGARAATREAEGWYDKDAIYIPAALLSQAAGGILQKDPLSKLLKKRELLARTEEHHNHVRFRDGKSRLSVYALVRSAFAPKEPEPVAAQQERLPYKDS